MYGENLSVAMSLSSLLLSSALARNEEFSKIAVIKKKFTVLKKKKLSVGGVLRGHFLKSRKSKV